MQTTLITLVIWYIIGLFSLCWAVKFKKDDIMSNLGPILAASLFGPIICLFMILDAAVDKVTKK